ncbi:glycosyltransferase family 2 protein [Flavobacterium stagni]|uniref:Glycosyltransferase family 2 protein n=1 Tax=Flavobacterium stagni TaxID=2506421 RepID=A0A4Q1KD59_9FLAO|nr:glycosyltransferase family 2 protein [Flavobacterium stagni]RXR23302.1 glycosyltransferase family 2 protein [Flavobacterium stagni]
MQLSVVILNYKVRYFLEQCLYSVQKATAGLEAEIIVVDNASSDDSCAMVRERFPEVKLIANLENYGFPKGNNIGVAEAKGKYLCILNPDTVVAEDTFTKIFSHLASHPDLEANLGILGCKLIDGTGHFLPESKRGVPTPWVAFTKIFGLYKSFPKIPVFTKYYAEHLTENESGPVDILVGAFMVMPREVYLELGGFDENCFMYSDDIDLSYLSLKSGRTNYYFHDTTVVHYKGESTVRDGQYMKRFREAMQFFYQKHFRRSFLFDVMMKVGAFLFSLFKTKQQKNRSVAPDSVLVFTKDKLEIKSAVPVRYETHLEVGIPENKGTIRVIFDTRYYTYQSILAFMQKHKNEGVQYRNYLAPFDGIIGSDNANDVGGVEFL